MDVDLLLIPDTLLVEGGDWPLGALWLDPSAEDGGSPTWGTTGLGGTSFTDLTPTTGSTWHRSPGHKQAVVSAPPTQGGVALVMISGSIQCRTAGINAELRLATSGGVTSSAVRAQLPAGIVDAIMPYCLQGAFPVAAGETIEVWVEHQYGSTPATAARHIRPATQVVFLPGAVASAVASEPPLHWWDGDSWRPKELRGATLDLAKDSTVVSPTKTPTTTTTARTPGSLTVGGTVTITATVTPAPATGTVTFYRGGSATGPWTSIGSVQLDAATDKAVKTWSPGTGGTYYFRAVYSGDATYATSAGVSSSTSVTGDERTVTQTWTASWQQAYNKFDDQVDTGNASKDKSVLQGQETSGGGDRKSLIGGFGVNLPADAEVDKVTLQCTNWASWDHKGNGNGTLKVGWHSQTSKPGSYNLGAGVAKRSSHDLGTGNWTVTLDWARTVVTRSDFKGVAVGPYGGSAAQGMGQSGSSPGIWKLKVTYKTRT